MKKYVVISTNNNPDYYIYASFMERAWSNFGWSLCVMITHDVDPLNLHLSNPDTIIVRLPEIPGLRDATVAQTGRLYAANYLPMDALIMTCDMDLLPLKDYWKPEPGKVTIFGHDLTWRTYYPMGYIAMLGSDWWKYMNCTYDTAKDMLRDANDTIVNGVKIAFSDKWEEWWNLDWQLVTNRLSPFKDQIVFIDRGQTKSGLAYGRVDRGAWEPTIKECETTEFIDAHLENFNTQHPDKMSKFLSLFNRFHS